MKGFLLRKLLPVIAAVLLAVPAWSPLPWEDGHDCGCPDPDHCCCKLAAGTAGMACPLGSGANVCSCQIRNGSPGPAGPERGAGPRDWLALLLAVPGLPVPALKERLGPEDRSTPSHPRLSPWKPPPRPAPPSA